MLAFVDTIKVLNDDALKLFKKTLPVKASNMGIQTNVMNNLQKLSLDDLRVDVLDEFKVEEGKDDAKEDYCNTELDKAEHSKKSRGRKIQLYIMRLCRKTMGVTRHSAQGCIFRLIDCVGSNLCCSCPTS